KLQEPATTFVIMSHITDRLPLVRHDVVYDCCADPPACRAACENGTDHFGFFSVHDPFSWTRSKPRIKTESSLFSRASCEIRAKRQIIRLQQNRGVCRRYPARGEG